MSTFLQFIITLVIIISAAKIGGYISLRLGQPSVLGELVIGILLGPSLLNLLNWAPFTDNHLEEGITHIAELGVLLLMFIAGLELHFSDLVKTGKVAALAGTLGVFLPLGMGYGMARFFSFDIQSSVFTGLILAATSVSISAQTLMEMKVLRSRVGIGMLGAAVFDDVLVVLGLSVFVAFELGSGGFWSVVWIAARMILFLGIATVAGMALLPKIALKVDSLQISQGLIAFILVTTLFYAWASEVLVGMAAITGAFLAGLVFSRSALKERIETGMSHMAYSFFVPVFFVNVGLSANALDITGDLLWLLLAAIVVAVISKIIGAGLGARLAGLTNLESLQIGAGMTSRGEVGLIVASVGIAEGIISPEIFSVIVGVVIVTTLLTPPMLRSLFAKNKVAA